MVPLPLSLLPKLNNVDFIKKLNCISHSQIDLYQ